MSNMKYARLKNGFLIDVYSVPGDFPDIETLNRCLPGGGFIEVPSDAVHGAKDNGDGYYTNPSQPTTPTRPIPLSKTAFMDLCWANLGGGATGMARFDEILEACRTTPGAIRSACRRYEAADIFEKSNVAQMFAVIASVLEEGEADAILNNWPEV